MPTAILAMLSLLHPLSLEQTRPSPPPGPLEAELWQAEQDLQMAKDEVARTRRAWIGARARRIYEREQVQRLRAEIRTRMREGE